MRSKCSRVLAQEAAASAGANTPLGAAAAPLYAPFNAAGPAGKGFSGNIKFPRGRA
jgi:3-hydroxyisobutyrate dehydrogenase